jgi:hypothetical protein
VLGYDLVNVSRAVDLDTDFERADAGVGLWVAFGGAAVAFAGRSFRSARHSQTSAGT